MTGWETVDVKGHPMQCYVAMPATGGDYPGVLVFMEIFGINPHIQDITERLAREGYVAIAPDYYHRVAPGIQLEYSKADIEQGRQYKAQVTQAHMIEDTEAAIAFLKQHSQIKSNNRFGSIGFCFGGYVAYVVATLPEIAITASFYGAGIATDTTKGPCKPVDKTPDISGYMLCLYGDKDTAIPQSDIQAIETALETAGVQHQIMVYPDADHGFFCDQRSSYDPEAAFDAWNRVKMLFHQNLKAPSRQASSSRHSLPGRH